ncbi:MAG: methyltransferase domain-containing protein, partial [Patescibacteria group bacterium]
MQSGRIIESLYINGFKKFEISNKKAVKRVLILGVGGGTVVQLISKKFPQANITGIDIDPVIVEVGKEYFNLGTVKNLQLIIGDVLDDSINLGKNFDLVIVDLFKGYKIPKDLGKEKILRKIRSTLAKDGLVIFNRLYFQTYKIEADLFLDNVQQIFQDVKVYRNYFNLLIRAR